MKKYLPILIIMVFLYGCKSEINLDKKYDKFERINFSLALANTRTFYDGDKISNYAVADITEETKDDGGLNGIFYQIENGEWILVKKIELCGSDRGRDLHRDSKYTYFYRDEKNSQNKLFTSRCMGSMLTEYILQDEKVIEKNLYFDTTSIGKKVQFYFIEKVEDNDIYYQVEVDYKYENSLIKCSLDSYICNLVDE